MTLRQTNQIAIYFKKQSVNSEHFIKICLILNVTVLTYENGDKANVIPGTTEEFTLSKY